MTEAGEVGPLESLCSIDEIGWIVSSQTADVKPSSPIAFARFVQYGLQEENGFAGICSPVSSLQLHNSLCSSCHVWVHPSTRPQISCSRKNTLSRSCFTLSLTDSYKARMAVLEKYERESSWYLLSNILSNHVKPLFTTV